MRPAAEPPAASRARRAVCSHAWGHCTKRDGYPALVVAATRTSTEATASSNTMVAVPVLAETSALATPGIRARLLRTIGGQISQVMLSTARVTVRSVAAADPAARTVAVAANMRRALRMLKSPSDLFDDERRDVREGEHDADDRRGRPGAETSDTHG